MSNETGLAAVHEAAGAISKADHDKGVATARTEADKAGYDRGVADGRKAGADAERARLQGIDAHAIPGHEKLIAECKADAACTPDMAAGRILAAEKQLRDDQMKGVRAVEEETGKVGAAAASQRQDGGGATPPKPGEAKSKEAYMADWEKSADLKADFATAESYANYAAGVAAGRIRILKAPVAG